MTLTTLPTEVSCHLFSCCSFKTVLALSATCTTLRANAYSAIASVSRLCRKYIERAAVKNGFLPQITGSKPYDVVLQKLRSSEVFSRFPAARRITLYDANASKESIFALLAACQDIIDFKATYVRALAPADFSPCPFPRTLKSVTLMGNAVGDQTIRSLAAAVPNLEELVLHRCKDITMAAFSGKTPFRSLKKLHLYSAALNDVALGHIFGCCPNLRNIKLNHAENCTGSTLAECAFVEFLEELDLQGTNLTSTLFKVIVGRAKRLVSLEISFCDHITREAFEEVNYPKTLKSFSGHWTNIGDNGLRRLLDATNLESLQLTSCTRLTHAVFQERPQLLVREKFDFGFPTV